MSSGDKQGDHGWAPDVGTGGDNPSTAAKEEPYSVGDPDRRPGREVSEEEQSGVPSTDTTGQAPLGVGVSSTKRAEEYGAEGEEGRETTGVKGASKRPEGKTDPAKGPGVDPQAPIDSDSPHLPPA